VSETVNVNERNRSELKTVITDLYIKTYSFEWDRGTLVFAIHSTPYMYATMHTSRISLLLLSLSIEDVYQHDKHMLRVE